MAENGMTRGSAGTMVAGLALILGACGSDTDSESVIETESGSSDYTIDADTGEESMVISTAEGEVSMRSGTGVPIDLPEGFSIIDGATITSNTVVDQAEGKGSLVGFQTSDSADTVAAFYLDQAKAAGIDIEIDAQMRGGRVLGGKSGSGTTFSMTAMPTDPDESDVGTRVQLIVGQGEDY